MKLTTSIFLSLIVIASTAFSTSSLAASTYKWTDDKGNVHYSQHPPRDRESERLKIKKAPRSSRTYQAPASSNSQGAATSGLPGSNQQGNTAEQESQSNTALRKKNCEAAKKNLKIYQVYRRVRDKEGNIKRISPDEREQRIKESKEQISEFCD